MTSLARGRSPWIFGDFYQDAIWLYAPGILAFFFGLLWATPDSATFKAYIFVGVVLLDHGHIFATGCRTYLSRGKKPLLLYLGMPVAVFLLLALTRNLTEAAIPLAMVFYMVRIWHNVRQNYGISKWYQRINDSFSRGSDFFLYALCLAPPAWVLLSRFGSRLFSGHPTLIKWLPWVDKAILWAYLSLFFAWVFFEVFAWRRRPELNRVLSTLVPVLLFSYGFIATDLTAYFLPIAIMHAISYTGLVHLSLKKTGSPLQKTKFSLVKLLVVTAFLGFAVETLASHCGRSPYAVISALSALEITFFYCHVWFDTLIWKSSHPEARLVYS